MSTRKARAELARLIAQGRNDETTDRFEADIDAEAEELAEGPDWSDDWQTGTDRYEREIEGWAS